MCPDETAAERVIGRYVLCDEVASGGMATVHIGRQTGSVGFARTVAIKRLHAQFAKNPEFVAMLLDEARLAARIRHPNVVSTLDVVADGGELLIVMEYVHGESIAQLVKAAYAAQERPPVGVVMSVIAGTLYGLHAAHEATDDHGAPLGVIHRDVSPQNIMVGVDGVARALDFGVAQAVGRVQTTREGTLKGKLAYMSPEQVEGDELDRRSDIFSASVVLWEMLVGRRLFRADNEAATLKKILSHEPVAPTTLVPELPPGVDALMMKGLARDRADRFATAWEMAEEAQRIAFATTGEVGAWTRRWGGAPMAARADLVAAMERRGAEKALVRAAASTAPDPEATVEDRVRARRAPSAPSAHAARAVTSPAFTLPVPTLELVASATSVTTPATGVMVRAQAEAALQEADAAPASVSGVRVPPPGPAPSAAVEPAPLESWHAPPAARVRPAVVAAGVVVGLAVGLIAFWPSAPVGGPVAAPEASSAAPPTQAAATAPPESPHDLPIPLPTLLPTLAAPRPPPPWRPPTTSGGGARPAPPVAAPPRARCNPPYTINANGIRIPKPDCL